MEYCGEWYSSDTPWVQGAPSPTAQVPASWCVVGVSFLRPCCGWRCSNSLPGKPGLRESIWNIRNLCGISWSIIAHVGNRYGVRMEYVWDMYGICVEQWPVPYAHLSSTLERNWSPTLEPYSEADLSLYFTAAQCSPSYPMRRVAQISTSILSIFETS